MPFTLGGMATPRRSFVPSLSLRNPDDFRAAVNALAREKRLGRIATLQLGVGHAVIGASFFGLGLPVLGLVNLGSVLIFAGAYFATATGRGELAKLICAVEMIAHAYFASRWVGLDAGFQCYLLLLAPAICTQGSLRGSAKAALIGVLMAVYIGIDCAVRPFAPHVVLAPAVLDLFRHCNTVALIYGLAFEMHWYAYTAVAAERQLNRLATLDPLTGLGNRRHLDGVAAHLTRSAAGHADGFSVVALDIDHFKRVNDKHGHAVGDEVLKAVAAALSAETRHRDHAVRLGGEEFVLVLPATGHQVALGVAERLADSIRRVAVGPLPGGAVTATLGVAVWRREESFDGCLRRADEALYRGKSSGRDRVVLAA